MAMALFLLQWVTLPFVFFFRTSQPSFLAGLLITTLAIILIGGTGFLLFFEWHYWQITKWVTVTLNPEAPEIDVHRLDEPVVITPQNTVRIEWHRSDPVRSGKIMQDYGYLIFYLHGGRQVVLNEVYFKWHEFLHHHFREVPRTFHYHRVPWVKPLPVSS